MSIRSSIEIYALAVAEFRRDSAKYLADLRELQQGLTAADAQEFAQAVDDTLPALIRTVAGEVQGQADDVGRISAVLRSLAGSIENRQATDAVERGRRRAFN